MQHVVQGYRGLSFLLGLNADRLFAIAMIAASLYAAAWVGTLITPH